jgi:Mrp family chromosome partitioning ATPase/uncharacterized protein involved in exopolysaccharide biosynthesis
MNLQRGQSSSLQQLNLGDGSNGVPPPMGSSPSQGDEQPLFRLDLARSLQLHRRLAVGIALTGLGLAAAFVATRWPVYSAQSQVYIQPVSPRVMDSGNIPRWPDDQPTYDSFIDQQVQSASYPDVLLGAVHRLRPGAWQKYGESDQAAALRLSHSVEVARMGTSYEVTITAQARSADVAAQLANAMAASLVEKVSREEKAGDPERQAILREEQERIKKELETDRAEQASLNGSLGVAAIGTLTPNHFDDEITNIHQELVKARTARDDAEAHLISMGADKEQTSKALDAEAEELVTADPGLISMKTSLNQRRAVLISQMSNLTPSHPQYKLDATELGQIDASLDSMSKDLRAKAASRIQQKLRADLDRTAGVEDRLNAQLGLMAGAAAGATPRLQRANDLATDIVRLQTRKASVDDQLHNLLLQDSVPGAAHLSAAAMPPLQPNYTVILKRAVPIALGGLLLAMLAALVANNLDQKIYIAADIERVLGVTPMAQLPNFDQVSDGVAEEHLLRLSASIEHAHQLGNVRSCIFTGTASGAGVTTVAGKLNSMLQSMGQPTVLVDAAWTQPLPAHSGSGGGLGLNDREAAGQMASQRGSRSIGLLQQLAEMSETGEENFILTDAAPLAVSAETEYLARFVDAAIVIVESGVTTHSQLREAANSLQRLDVAAVGFVLNRISLEKADQGFRHSIREMEHYLRAQSGSFKSDLEAIQQQRKLQLASSQPPAMPRTNYLPKPDTHLFYVSEWRARYPDGDVQAAMVEAKRQGYEVVES